MPNACTFSSATSRICWFLMFLSFFPFHCTTPSPLVHTKVALGEQWIILDFAEMNLISRIITVYFLKIMTK